ncbi:hypothetical protein [Butyrivibrio sp. XPD2006]|uniref:hypothetical protein n=1 Tax=Butyrivibrio sp. XPD2006 TaxID=1280668 RepID=UPI00040746D6|nr:hypothetical protein [Butyrivibrio sp. XPD2006]
MTEFIGNSQLCMDLLAPITNVEVTKSYFDIVVEAAKGIGIECQKVNRIKIKRENGKRIVFVATIFEAIKARLAGYNKVVLWVQGIAPEESLVRRSSYLRWLILSCIEYIAVLCSDAVFFVSEEMKRHYQHKYNLKPLCFIMPCFNERIDKASFDAHDYGDNTFVYSGGISDWHCFTQIVNIYGNIEKKYGENVKLCVLTKQTDEAGKILEECGIKNYSVKYVKKEEICHEMTRAKFGFCIRDDSKVNNVATPTKLSSYVCNGVIPIYSSAIVDFYRQSKESRYCLCYDDALFWDKLDGLIKEDISPESIFIEYSKVFGNYYSSDYYINGIQKFFENLTKNMRENN